MLIQIIIIVFALFAISRVLLRFRERTISLWEMIIWTVIWLGIGIAVLIPQITTTFANLLGVGRGADALIYLSVVVLFYGMFRLYIKQEHIEREITQLVRSLALMDNKDIRKDEDRTRQ